MRVTSLDDANRGWSVEVEVTDNDLIETLMKWTCYGHLDKKKALLKELIQIKQPSMSQTFPPQ